MRRHPPSTRSKGSSAERTIGFGAWVRPGFALLHRWAGLLIAGFLFFSGLTGAVISWDHDLDEWLNPRLVYTRADGPALPVLELARQIEARHPQVQVTFEMLQRDVAAKYDFELVHHYPRAHQHLRRVPATQEAALMCARDVHSWSAA